MYSIKQTNISIQLCFLFERFTACKYYLMENGKKHHTMVVFLDQFIFISTAFLLHKKNYD